MSLTWEIKSFDELSREQLYDILRLRAEVFVVEQDCPYVDPDGKDPESFHLCGYENGELIAYARIVKPGISYKEWAVGRVVVRKDMRHRKLGSVLMERAISFITGEKGGSAIRISAQSHLNRFYGDLGFVYTGKSYLEDGIPHIEMLWTGA